MRPVLTPSEAAELDRETQRRGIAAIDLMERAGRAVAHAAIEVAGGVYGRRAVVICGKGNNGGDGLVAARHLARQGMRVDVVIVDGARSAGPPAANLDRLAEQGVAPATWDPARVDRSLARADVAVDAVFGTGFRGEPDGVWREAIGALEASTAPVVAVDIPSGIDGATGQAGRAAVRADLTVTFGALKLGSVMMPGADLSGVVRVVDIGFPADLIRPAVGLVEPDDVAEVLPRRRILAHKRSSGVLLVVAGSRRMTGAPALIARAAGRIGTGLVIVATPADAVPAVQASTVEAVFLPLPQTASGAVALGALDDLLEAAHGADALAIGPGLSRDEETARLVRELVARCPVPSVVDADGLNAFRGDAGAIAERTAEAVLTPHDGEFARVMARAVEGFPDRVAAARALAEEASAVALLKGPRTVVAPPAGLARVNPTGTAALATAGTGDVLTGVVGGLLARRVVPVEAATAGAFLHGVAGVMAAGASGEGTLAGDVVERIPDAVAEVLA